MDEAVTGLVEALLGLGNHAIANLAGHRSVPSQKWEKGLMTHSGKGVYMDLA